MVDRLESEMNDNSAMDKTINQSNHFLLAPPQIYSITPTSRNTIGFTQDQDNELITKKQNIMIRSRTAQNLPTSGQEDQTEDDETDIHNIEQLVYGDTNEYKEKNHRIKGDIDSMYKRLERMETDYELYENQFDREIASKGVEIEHLDPQHLGERENQIEFQELKRLEKQLKKVEKEKISLLYKEQHSEKELFLTSGFKALDLSEIESRFEFKARERERALTKLYGKLNSKIKAQILSHEGISQSQIRKIKPYVKDKIKNQRLFEGIRDQKVGAKWLKTPQPVEIKIMMIRSLKDKIPKGSYAIRAGILDRLVENKIYYKFLEYGSRVKAEQEAKKEQEEQAKIEQELLQKNLSSGLFNSDKSLLKHSQEDLPLLQVQQLEEDKQDHQILVFDNPNSKRDEIVNNEESKHGVHFGGGNEDDDEDEKEDEENKLSARTQSKPLAFGSQKTQINEFDKMARQSLYKPEGGSISQNNKNQSIEKVWIDFGKQHTKLVEFDGNQDSEEMDFQGHKIYFLSPPNLYLAPSNVIIFELVWLSSQTSNKDYIVAWGAFPLVNGDFEINEGKLKLPLLNGPIDFSANKFKDIEKKYIRNIDEWVGNLYIEVKKFEIVDFQVYNQRIELKIPKEEKKKEVKKKKKAYNKILEFEFNSNLSNYQQQQDEETKKDEGAQDESLQENADEESDFEVEEEDKQGVQIDDQIDYHQYKYTIAQTNSDLKPSFETKDLQIRKLQYVIGEILNDLGIKKIEFQSGVLTLFIAFIVLWIRMALHYLGQYLLLKIMNAPVISVELHWYKVKIEYSYWSIAQEVGVITMGTVTNSILFLLFILICYLSQKYIYCFPRSFCRFIAWYGLATVFDFFLVSVIDFAIQDWNGDLFKLYLYYSKSDSSGGFVGYFLTFIIHLGLLIVNLFIFYNYIVFIHMDGRLSDIYMRINGKVKNFFIPQDNEVSFNYLRHIYQIGEINNNRIIVNKLQTVDALTCQIHQQKLVHFYKFESEISLDQGRAFVINTKGQILETNIAMIGAKNDQGNISFFMKNIERMMGLDLKRTQLQRFNTSLSQSKNKSQQNILNQSKMTLARRLTLQSCEKPRSSLAQQLRQSISIHGNSNNLNQQQMIISPSFTKPVMDFKLPDNAGYLTINGGGSGGNRISSQSSQKNYNSSLNKIYKKMPSRVVPETHQSIPVHSDNDMQVDYQEDDEAQDIQRIDSQEEINSNSKKSGHFDLFGKIAERSLQKKEKFQKMAFN